MNRERVLLVGFLAVLLCGLLTVAWPELSGDDELPKNAAKSAPLTTSTM
jgi:hypothetical protein